MKKSGKKSKVSKQRNRRITRRHQVSLDISDQMRGKVADVMTLAGATAGVVTLASMLHAGPVYALPQGGNVVAGSASIAQTNAAVTTITQNSSRAVINWQAYGIGAKESLRYIQPSSSSIVLNRVVGQSPTAIHGQLSANGQVWVSNPNGILVGPDAVINTAGFLATTLHIGDQDFMAGKDVFTNPTSSLASIINQGKITATDGGYVVLAGPSVTNSGSITASRGKVHLASGDEMTLTFAGNDLIGLVVDKATAAEALGVVNSGSISADGGQVLLTAKVAGDLLKNVINNSGLIEARSISEKNGIITLDSGSSGSTINSGVLDASGKNAGESGGTVKVLGNKVELQTRARVDVSGDTGGGTALIGGNFHGIGSERNAAATTIAEGASVNADAITSGNGGKIAVWSDGLTEFSGHLSARGGAQAGNGGFVETSGTRLKIADNATVNTLAPKGVAGRWLLDPVDFNIADVGDMTGATLSGNLENGNVTILSSKGASGVNGDINVNNSVVWSNTTTLELSAYNNVNVTQLINPTGGGSVILRADNTGTKTGTVNFTGLGHITLSSFTNPNANATIYYNPLNNDYNNLTDYSKYITLNFGSASYYALLFLANGAADKVYDGTITALLGSFALYNNPAGVQLTGAIAEYVDKNAGANKVIILTQPSLTGTNVDKYALFDRTTGTITPKDITSVTGITADNKIYDGGTSATLQAVGAEFTGVISGDTLTATAATGAFVDKNAGIGKTVNITGISFGGADAGNYKPATGLTTTATITPKDITAVTGITAANKVYDGGTGATLNTVGALFTGKITGDTLTVATATGAFVDKNAANGKTVNISGISMGGADAGNYNLTTTAATTTANITPKDITAVTGITAANKVYDGGTVATLNTVGAGFTGKITGDTLTVATATGAFVDKNVANGKTVNVSGISLGGTDGGNYNLINTTAITTANITRLSSVIWTGAGDGRSWSDAKNWAGSAIPDMANVAQVNIPVGTTVVFDGDRLAWAGPVQVDKINDQLPSVGNLTVNSGSLIVKNSVTVAGYEQTGGVVNVGAPLNAGAFTVNNSYTHSGGSLKVDGALSITGTGGSAITFGDTNVTGALNVTADGNVTQTAALTVGGISTINAGANAITLDNVGNDFSGIALTGGAINVYGKNALIVNSLSNGKDQGVSLTAGGQLTLPVGKIDTGASDLILSSGGTFNTPGDLAGKNVSLTGATGITLAHNVTADGGSSGVGTVTLTSGGKITETNTGQISGSTLVMSAADAIDVFQKNNNVTMVSAVSTGTTAATSGIAYRDVDAVTVGTETNGLNSFAGRGGGAITVVTGGLLTISNDINAGTGTGTTAGAGTVTLISGGGIIETTGKIMANSLGMNAAGPINAPNANDVTAVSAGSTGTTPASIIYNDVNAVDVGAMRQGSIGLMVNSGGNISMTAGGDLTINSDIYAGTGSLTLTSRAGITVGTAVKLVVDHVNMNAGNLNMVTAGPIINSANDAIRLSVGGMGTISSMGGTLTFVESKGLPQSAVAAATMSVNSQKVDKMMQLSNVEEFFKVTPRESIITMDGAMLKPPSLRLLKGVTPESASYILQEKEK